MASRPDSISRSVHNMVMMEEATKIIENIRFSLLSPNEIRRLSAVEVQTADTYDEDGVPIVSGLMDGRLGTLEPRQKCKTCGNTAVSCPGHSGHIELAEPVIQVAFSKLIHKFLSSLRAAIAAGFSSQTRRLRNTVRRLPKRRNASVRCQWLFLTRL